MEACNMRRIASMAQGYQICHCEERSDVAISQNPTGQQGSHRRNRNCLPEIAPQGHFLALRAQGATAPLGPRNDKLGSLAPQNMCRKDCQTAWRSLSAATVKPGGVYGRRCLSHSGSAFPRLPRPRWGLAMTNLGALRRRMRAAKIASLHGAH